MSPHAKMSGSSKIFLCRVHNFHVKIIKQIQASNEKFKFQVDLYKYYDVFNDKYYFMIQIIPKWCPSKTNKKFAKK